MSPLFSKLSRLCEFSCRNLSQKSLSSRNFKSPNLGQFLRFGRSQKVLVQKIKVKKIKVQKDFGSKKIWGTKKI